MELWISDYVNFMLQNVKEHKYSWHKCFMMHWTSTEERKINHVTMLQSKNVYVAASRWLQSRYNVTSSATWNSCSATKWQKIVDLPSFQLVVQHHLNACGMITSLCDKVRLTRAWHENCIMQSPMRQKNSCRVTKRQKLWIYPAFQFVV